jgi:hypothetical protein
MLLLLSRNMCFLGVAYALLWFYKVFVCLFVSFHFINLTSFHQSNIRQKKFTILNNFLQYQNFYYPINFLQYSLQSDVCLFIYLNYLFIYSLIHSIMHLYINSFSNSFIHSFIYSFIPSFVQSFNYSFINSFVHSCIHSFIPSFIHSFILVFSAFSRARPAGDLIQPHR